MADRAPLQVVVRRLQELRAAGRTAAEGAQEAAAMGWTPDEIKASVAGIRPADNLDFVAQGLTFGTADEISAALAAPIRALRDQTTMGEAFNRALEQKRTALELRRQAAPVQTTASEIVGGTLLPIPGRAPRSLMGAVGKGTAVGAATGAAYGAGTGENTDDRIDRAIIGAATGGVVGGAVPLVAGAVRGARAQSNSGAQGMSRALVADALADEGMTGNQAADAIRDANRAGKTGVTVMDVAQGNRVLGLGEDVANSPNALQPQLTQQIGGRQRLQYDRITSDLERLSGIQSRRAVRELEGIANRRRLNAGPAFDAAWQFDTASNPAIRQAFTELMQSDAGPRAYQRAVMIARNEMPGYRPPAISELVDAAGNLVAIPDARFMHFMKMGLDDLYSSAARGETGMGQTVARSIQGVRNAFRDTLKTENPAYGRALDQFAGDMALQNALEEGRTAVMLSPDEMAAAMRGMSASEIEHFRIGALTRVIDTLGNKRPGPTANVAGALTSANFVRKIALLMPDPAAREAWTRAFDTELAFSQTAERTLGNSRTAGRLATAEALDGDEMAGRILSDAGQGLPTSFWQMVTSALGRISKPVADAAKRARRNATGQMLLETDQAAEAFLRGLDNRPPVIGYQAPRLSAPAAVATQQAIQPPPQQPLVPYRR